MIGTTEALIIGGIVLLIFGAKKLPELAKGLGQSKAAFDEGLGTRRRRALSVELGPDIDKTPEEHLLALEF